MTTPNDKPRKSPADRFHSILSAGQKPQTKEDAAETRKSPALNLPKARPATKIPVEVPPAPPHAGPRAGPRLKKEQLLPAFWTVASILSIAVNIILLAALIIVLRGLGSVDAAGVGSGLLGGLYANFERMDQARIKANVLVQDNIALNMNIPVQTTTGIILAQDVVIRNARVKISTASFNIDSPADVTLPAGTPLIVALDFIVPLQTQVPVTLNVPVDIPIQDTELHPAIAGLQDTIKPLYCILAPTALSLNGAPVCR